MICQQCKNQIDDGLVFCTNCGAKQINVTATPVNNIGSNNTQSQNVMNGQFTQSNNQFTQPFNQQGFNNQFYSQQNTFAYTNANINATAKKVSFGEAIKLFFVNYVNFTGRSTVGEYWWSFLFCFLVELCTSWIPVVGQLIILGFLLPSIAVSVRRLHDTGKSWPYMLMGLIPLAGFIILIVQYCKESDVDNKWGPTPSGR